MLKLPRSLTALQHRNYRLLWIGLLISMAGKVSNIAAFDDNEGVKVLTYTFDAVFDAAWGSGQFLTVQYTNKTAAL